MIATALRWLSALGRWATRQHTIRTRHEWDYWHSPVLCTRCGDIYNRLNYDDPCDDTN